MPSAFQPLRVEFGALRGREKRGDCYFSGSSMYGKEIRHKHRCGEVLSFDIKFVLNLLP